MAIGVFGLYGMIVARHVVVVKEPDEEPATIQAHSMVEKTAKDPQLKLEITTCKDVVSIMFFHPMDDCRASVPPLHSGILACH